ncbi:DNA-directed RNA polymerase subunit omega [Thermodesulfitimonas autotrophica]|uniref:DNA-directed RNA polymerase subunit omega n=1 Tax=Thermodesulfitimonas autotrophica TaxID=1894989 RepID=UPI002FE34DA4
MPMNEPPLDDLLKVSKNRYVLAIVAAKQARYVTDKINAGLLDNGIKPVSQGLRDIAAGRVKFILPKKGVK